MSENEKIHTTKYEKARMIGARALQISMGAPFLVKLEKKDLEEIKYNPVKIAMMEYDKGILPLIVKRILPDTRKKEKKSVDEKDKEEED